jgi:lysophospholipase L1-like esterase
MENTLEKLRKQEPVTIVAIGDSTNVLCMHTKGRLPWLGYLHMALAETYGDGFIYTINSSFCGGTVRVELERLERDVLRFHPDLTIIGFGINDSGGGLEELENFRKNYREMVRRIREVGSEVLVRVHAPFVNQWGYSLPEGAEPGKAWDGPDNHRALYARALVELAKELGCQCCDHYSKWKQKSFPFKQPQYNPQGLCCRYVDTVHPNMQGHLAFFRDLAPLFGVPKYFVWEEVE